jgi:alkanesulfonate monooxygenase
MALHPSIRRPVEFIGLIGAAPFSEVEGIRRAAVVDPEYTRALAQAHDAGDFDRVLIGYSADGPDGWQVAAYAAQHTERVGFLIAHRPGFVQPTLAARYAATLDQYSRGRVALHIITGGSDADQARDGDFLPKEERYARSGEYMQVLKLAWNAPEAFSYHGRFYRFEDVKQEVRPYQGRDIPLYFGGSSAVALDIGTRYADVYAMFGEPVEDVRATIADLKARAAHYDRPYDLGFSVSLRPILGATEEQAWERARRFLAIIRERKQQPESTLARRFIRRGANDSQPFSEGSRRLLAVAERGEVLDERLFTAIARETGAAGNSTALVGTPEQVARALLRYVEVGATTLLIRGFEPLRDAVEYGRDLVPLVRQELAHRARQQ